MKGSLLLHNHKDQKAAQYSTPKEQGLTYANVKASISPTVKPHLEVMPFWFCGNKQGELYLGPAERDYVLAEIFGSRFNLNET